MLTDTDPLAAGAVIGRCPFCAEIVAGRINKADSSENLAPIFVNMNDLF